VVEVTNLIYGLVDPRTLLVRYVGYSSTGVRRPRQHRSAFELRKRTHKTAWIKSLLAEGLEYTIVVLEEVSSRDTLADAERFWIAFGRACGWPLTNLTDGGEGLLNPSDETRAKMRTSNLGQKRHARVGQAIGAANRQRVWTIESRRKLGAAHLGRKRPPETGAKISAAKRARDAKARAEKDA
jgi:hypothetical protein